jgi:hypothetical protein
MKVASLTIMKNEADILPYKLKYMEDQVDYYLFLDNESEDDSLEIVSRHPKTVFCDVVKGTFKTTMVDILLEEAQKYIGNRDWIVRLDPDEFPFFNIKNEINKIENSYNCIRVYFPYFFFTKEMYVKWENDRNFRKKIKEFDIANYNYFARTVHAEVRIIKNFITNGERPKLTKLKLSLPRPDPALIYDNKLYCGHYQYRSPEQIMKRMEVRKKAVENGSPSFHYYKEKWGLKNWDYKKLFVPEKYLVKYDYDKPFTLNGIELEKMNKHFYKLFNPRKILIPTIKYLFKK